MNIVLKEDSELKKLVVMVTNSRKKDATGALIKLS
jgi:hypothetical protein